MNSSQQLDTDLLRTFLTVARHGNVTRGAEALHRTQSAVSIQIKRLEESLAARLFRREPRGVSLTEAGERLRAAAERIVGDLDETVRTFRADPIGGLVRVGIPEEYGAEVLPAVLADFSARFPAVEVFVRCGFSVEFPEAIRRGELDLAVFADCRRFEQSDTLIRDPMAWVSSRPWRCRDEEPVPLALFDRACAWRDVAIQALEDAGQPYRIVFSSESTAGIKAAIATGPRSRRAGAKHTRELDACARPRAWSAAAARLGPPPAAGQRRLACDRCYGGRNRERIRSAELTCPAV